MKADVHYVLGEYVCFSCETAPVDPLHDCGQGSITDPGVIGEELRGRLRHRSMAYGISRRNQVDAIRRFQR